MEAEEKNDEDVDIIGQFGVGFYSAFMVASDVVVESRKAGEEEHTAGKAMLLMVIQSINVKKRSMVQRLL